MKGCLVVGCFLAGVVILGGVYVFKELENSPLLDQYLSERYGLLRCFKKLSTGELSEPSQCSQYAQTHLPLYPEFIAKTPAEAACLVSKDILKILKIDYPSSLGEIKLAEKRVERFCKEQQFTL